jgi:hypothetical protein
MNIASKLVKLSTSTLANTYRNCLTSQHPARKRGAGEIQGVCVGVDTMNVEGDTETARRYCRLALGRGLHLEITTLVIPGVNDRNEVLKGIPGRILTQSGPDVPPAVAIRPTPSLPLRTA